MNMTTQTPHRHENAVMRLGRAVLKPSLFILCVISLLLSSCQSANHISYFQDADTLPDTLSFTQRTPSIQSYDELKIIVTAENAAAVATFNKPMFSERAIGSRTVNQQSHLQSYLVDEEGNIDFPTLGRIHVAGMTTEQLAVSLQQQISHYVKDPIVSIDPISIRVEVLGEVTAPGTIFLYADNATLMNALAQVHDLTIYGDRRSVLIIRTEGDKKIKHRVDLTSTASLTDPMCNLRQNDIIYVEPNDARRASSQYNNMKQQNISLISTVVSVASVLTSLAIAIWK